MGGVGRARGVLDFALGGGGGGGAGGTGGDGGSGRSAAADEEGLGLLRQQLSAVQRIRVEHERKDAAIAALRLEVSERGWPRRAGCCQPRVAAFVPDRCHALCFVGEGKEGNGKVRERRGARLRAFEAGALRLACVVVGGGVSSEGGGSCFAPCRGVDVATSVQLGSSHPRLATLFSRRCLTSAASERRCWP